MDPISNHGNSFSFYEKIYAVISWLSPKASFLKLISFLHAFLTACKPYEIDFLLSGSLAVFMHAQDPDLIIHDVDLACPESQFSLLEELMRYAHFQVQLRDYHVLQVTHKKLKIDLDSLEFWYRDIPMSTECCKINRHQIKILSLESLLAFYQMGVDTKYGHPEEFEKYSALKYKLDLMEELIDI